MGGKALNKYGVFTERKDTTEFLRIGEEIQDSLHLYFLNYHGIQVETCIVTCYRTKPDHGDLDLLVKVTPEMNIDFRKEIGLFFLPQAINSNGGVHSFDYQGFQIDFIPVPETKWETAKTYYSYDPLGNIMGKTFHKFGLSYGWEGLFYKFRNFHGSNSKDILLTNDARKIFTFGGYDYDRYLKGFDTLEEIFMFCIDSKYFDSEMFQMENLKSIDKKRNRKRGSYHLFLNYLKDNGINTKFQFNVDKDSYLLMIDEFFSEADLLGKLYELKMKDSENKIISQKFNGDMVMQWLPNLQGKELGAAMSKFKATFTEENFNAYILNSSFEEIKNFFMYVYNDRTDS
jgi:hypothetical protein